MFPIFRGNLCLKIQEVLQILLNIQVCQNALHHSKIRLFKTEARSFLKIFPSSEDTSRSLKIQ